MSKSLRMTKTTPFSSTTLLLKGHGPDRNHKVSSKINRNHTVPKPRLLLRLTSTLNKEAGESQTKLFDDSEMGTLGSPPR